MSVVRPRGKLPARVYWTRRVLVLGVAFALVFGIGRLLGGDDSPDPAAQPAAVVGSATPTAVSTADAATATPTATPTKKRTKPPLAMPSGPCQDSDVRVVPDLQEAAYAGSDVRLTLRLTTYESPACTWTVDSDTVVVRLTSGSDRIWTSQQCPKAVPEQQVVLRDRKATFVDVIWSGRRSDEDCSRTTLWAEPGWYHVAAAAMGSEPEAEQFELRRPAPVTITPSPTPAPERKKKSQRSDDTDDD